MNAITKPKTKESMASQARSIYVTCLQNYERGDWDDSLSFRQYVLQEFTEYLDASPATLSGYYNACLKAKHKYPAPTISDTSVNATAPEAVKTFPLCTDSKLHSISKKFTMKGAPLEELMLVPLDGDYTGSLPRPPVLPAPCIVKPLVPPNANSHAADRAMKVHADLIDLCKSVIDEAVVEMQELVDNIDFEATAPELRRFTRKMRNACRRIDGELGTQSKLDKKQENKILPGLRGFASNH